MVSLLGENSGAIGEIRAQASALRPPSNVKGHTAALHWGSRLKSTDVGGIPKLTPLSVRGPHGNGSIVALSRLLSNSTHLISRARQGVLVLVKIQAHLTKITAQKSAKPWCQC